MTITSVGFEPKEVALLKEAVRALAARKREAFEAVRESGGRVGAVFREGDFWIPQLETLHLKLEAIDMLTGTMERDNSPCERMDP